MILAMSVIYLNHEISSAFVFTNFALITHKEVVCEALHIVIGDRLRLNPTVDYFLAKF